MFLRIIPATILAPWSMPALPRPLITWPIIGSIDDRATEAVLDPSMEKTTDTMNVHLGL
jgi:hypothetical protein